MTPPAVLLSIASALRPLNITPCGLEYCGGSVKSLSSNLEGDVWASWGEALRSARAACAIWPDKSGVRSFRLPESVVAQLPFLVESVSPRWRPAARVAVLIEASAVAWAALDRSLAKPRGRLVRPRLKNAAARGRGEIRRYLGSYRCSQFLVQLLRRLHCGKGCDLGHCAALLAPESQEAFLFPLHYFQQTLLHTNNAAWLSVGRWPWWRRANLSGEMVDPAARDEVLHRAFRAFIHGLRSCVGLVEWWPTDGTLLALLRYGDLRGHLTNGKVDVVDRDLDFMVGVHNESDWEDVQHLFPSLLEYNAAPDDVECGARIDGRTQRHFLASQFVLDSVECTYCAGERASQRHFNPRACVVVSMQRYLIDSRKRVAIVQRICNETGGCVTVSDAAPLQHWRGELPLRLLRPFGLCRGPGGASLPCPRSAVAVLSLLNEGEHAAGGASCLAFPFITGERQADDERNWRLLDEGLDTRDLDMLVRFSHGLASHGFASFWGEISEPQTPCGRILTGGSGSLVLPQLVTEGPDDLFELRSLMLRKEMEVSVLHPEYSEHWEALKISACAWLALTPQCEDLTLHDVAEMWQFGEWLPNRLLAAFPTTTAAAGLVAISAVLAKTYEPTGTTQLQEAKLVVGQIKKLCGARCNVSPKGHYWVFMRLQEVLNVWT